MSATGMHPCRRGRAAGGVGAAGDDQGPATARQQGPGRTDADITAWGGQGSGGSAAGDPTARPRGPPPTGPASRPVGTAVPPACSMRRRCQQQGPWMNRQPGADKTVGAGKGILRPGRAGLRRHSQRAARQGTVPLSLVPGGAVAGGRGPGWTDAARGGQGRGHRAGDLAARAFGNGTSRRNYEYYCQILTIPL